MKEITDQYMLEMISKTKHYSVVILRHGPNWTHPGMKEAIWEHGRRNFQLRESG